jgi:hypothetical protein
MCARGLAPLAHGIVRNSGTVENPRRGASGRADPRVRAGSPDPASAGRGAGRGGRGGRGQSPRLQSANAHYLIGLGYLGLGDAAKAKAELTQAVDTSPDLLGARTALAALK